MTISARSAGSAPGRPITSAPCSSRGSSCRRPRRSRTRVETALSGAGWEASGSQSVQARELIDKNFGGQSSAALMVVVHSPDAKVGDPEFTATIDRVAAILRDDPAGRLGGAAARGVLDLAGRSHGDRQRRRERLDDRDGRGRRRPEGRAPGCRSERRAGEPDRRLRHVVGLQRGQPQRDDEVRAALLARHAHHPDARLRLARRRRPAADADDPRARRVGRNALHRHEVLRHLDLGDELRAHVRARARDRLRALRRAPLPRRVLRLEAVGA